MVSDCPVKTCGGGDFAYSGSPHASSGRKQLSFPGYRRMAFTGQKNAFHPEPRCPVPPDPAHGASSAKEREKQPNNDEFKRIKNLTDKQLSRLYAIASKASLNKDQIAVYVKKMYNKDHAEQMNRQEYDQLIESLEKKINKNE